MLQPGRNYQPHDGYRFGFNGKEMDKDFGGGNPGTVYDYGFRIYDARMAKFLSVDPLTKSYPWYTPYQFAGNKPIAFIDLDGLEEYYYFLAWSRPMMGMPQRIVNSHTVEYKYNPETQVKEKIEDKTWRLYFSRPGRKFAYFEFESEQELLDFDKSKFKYLFKKPTGVLNPEQALELITTIGGNVVGGPTERGMVAGLNVEVTMNQAKKEKYLYENFEYSVIIGSFTKLKYAEEFVDKMKENFENVEILDKTDDGYYRISVGKFNIDDHSRADALELKNEAEKIGLRKPWLLFNKKTNENN